MAMRTGLLILRSCVGLGYQGGSAGRPHHPQLLFVPPRNYNNHLPGHSTLHAPNNNYIRPSSSLSTSSFEAPEPPSSQGQAVFPDIKFESNTDISSKRNEDSDAVFVVNGSSRGIGLQFVISLLDRTKGKVIACCRSPSTTTELNKIATKYPDRLQILPLDVEDQSSIDTLAETIAENYSRVDVLFNVAGILGDGGKTTPGPERSMASIERDWLEKTLAVNVIGPTMLAKSLAPLMRTTGRRSVKINDMDITLPTTGRPPTVIVNLSARVGSISDNQLGGWYSYRISKAALNQSTRTMGLELKRQGTHIIALHPGTTATDLSKPFSKNVKEGRLFPVEFTVEKLLNVVDSVSNDNNGGFYDWAGKALPF